MAETKPATQEQTKAVTLVDSVMQRVAAMQGQGRISFPPDYSPMNALNSAWLTIQDVKDKDGKYALAVCEKASIANSMFNMVCQGLNPVKKQCYFIVYGNQLTLMRSYFGTASIARRVGKLQEEPVAQCVYEGEKFKLGVDNKGRSQILEHEPNPDLWLPDKIKGCYATAVRENGETQSEYMTLAQIKKCWNFGVAKGQGKPHLETPDQMCKKTVISRLCKMIVNSSNDADLGLVEAFNATEDAATDAQVSEAKQDANSVTLNTEDYAVDKQTGEVADKPTEMPGQEKIPGV